jgi:hypothetical protein
VSWAGLSLIPAGGVPVGLLVRGDSSFWAGACTGPVLDDGTAPDGCTASHDGTVPDDGTPARGVAGARVLDGGLPSDTTHILPVVAPPVAVLPAVTPWVVLLLLLPGAKGAGQGRGASRCTLPGEGDTAPSCVLPPLL